MFAIVLTVLTFDLKIPDLGMVSDQQLWNEIMKIMPIFMSFVLSFALVFTYWRAHHFVVSIYAKNIDSHLASINALFFFFVALIPASSRILGSHSYSKLAIIIYATNIIFISLTLLWMRTYVLKSGHIEHGFVTASERRRGVIRVLVPMICAVIAIVISFYSTYLSFFILTFAIVFNLLSKSTKLVDKMLVSLKS